MSNPSQEPPVFSKAPNQDLKKIDCDYDFILDLDLKTSFIEVSIESQFLLDKLCQDGWLAAWDGYSF